MTFNLNKPQKHFVFISVILVVHFLEYSQAYCWQAGWNPSFTGPPVVSEIQPDVVRVSWAGIVTRKNCTDSFMVKIWGHDRPSNYKESDKTDANADFLDIRLKPTTSYTIQAIAIEDKGIMGLDYNKSPFAEFTSDRIDNILVTSETTTIGNPKEDGLQAYKTIRSGTCESNGLDTIATYEECLGIVKAFTELGFYSGYDRNYGTKNPWAFTVAHTLLVPFGCLYTDVTKDGVYWSEPISVQSSLPCGSKAEGSQFFCFCKNSIQS